VTSTATPDRAAFEREALPQLDAVYRFALRLSGSPDAAEDLVQETFLRAYRARGQYKPGTSAKSWLFTICRNVFLRGQERRVRHDEIVTQEAVRSEVGGGQELANPLWTSAIGTDPEGSFFGEIVDARILAALDSLAEEFRTVVVLSDLEDFGYGEIAEVLDVPVGTVKSRLFRGRRQLQTMLYDYAVEMEYIRPRGSKESGEIREP
jgi:RNA polymerase sigma-70 factor (ECF subfamily)